MTLGTADAEGDPWVSPVFFAAEAYRDFYWIRISVIETRSGVGRTLHDRTPMGHGDTSLHVRLTQLASPGSAWRAHLRGLGLNDAEHLLTLPTFTVTRVTFPS
jgi:hypothetical protein